MHSIRLKKISNYLIICYANYTENSLILSMIMSSTSKKD